ncbi:winged helix-turn-helix domain-containing protein [Streptomyces sp. GMY02]|uniref:AfsR/SARP family transcriptional regulator n=1 Tax=Streptomyces sp. GMY02 TaxID=1333528 RepID=UPI001C2BC7BE|nr:BTAD domain-containing putative transcriptional regulator [Streptomyces sp. GMY02]QXE36074.1 winged helix-turn-helix domain-containing protein [Streptomyces sp. GMY02]
MRYLILGTTEARDDHGGGPALGGARVRALLCALALRPGRAVAVTELVDDVWGDEPPHDAPAALQALVGRLRRALGKEAIDSVPGGGYRLAAVRDDVDLYVFERLAREGAARLDAGDPVAAARTLREALALWRGPALADLPGHGREYAVRPEAQRLAAHKHRIEADLRRGATDTLVPELMELVAAHPYDEPFRAQFIRALWAEGRRADALAAYEDTRRALADGLGADPGPELAALHKRMRAGDGPPVGGNLSTGTSPPPGTSPLTSTSTSTSTSTRPGIRPDTGIGTGIGMGISRDTGIGTRTDTGTPTGAEAGRPGAEPRGNLRPRLTSFVGREPELEAIRADLSHFRLVTLTGPGGSGKTRLAEESAPSGAWLVELAPLEAPSAVPGAVVSALGLRETQLTTHEVRPVQDDPTARLVEHLARRDTLLILDNCEHVIGAAAALAETLLTRCPGLRILATSREPLGVWGEVVRPVEPLPPDPAFRLFAERGRAVRPGFEAGEDAGAVGEICRRLDGLPLAIELAAARLRMLSPRQIADRLDDRFRLLTSGSRTVLPRQQTLRAVVDWSWDLLDERERTVLRQVSVFAGGWDLTAAEGICAGAPHTPGPHTPGPLAPGAADVPGVSGAADVPGVPGAPDVPDVPDVLGALVDKSLVVAAPAPGGGMRYRLLETIHEYAAERAAEAPAVRAAAERAHIAYFTGLAEQADPLLRSGEQLPWIRRLETELDNIRAALHRSVAARDEESALRLVLAMSWFWWLRNYRAEGLSWTEHALALGPDKTDPADPSYWPRMQSQVMWLFYTSESGQTEQVRTDPLFRSRIRRMLEVFGRPGPQSARLPGLLWCMLAYFSEETVDIRAAMDDAIANCRVHGGDWEVGVMVMGRAHMSVDLSGGMTAVDEDLAELRELTRRVGDRWMLAQIASATGEARMARGRYEEARDAYEEALRFAREVGAHAEAPFLLARLAELAYRAGDSDAAEKGLDAASADAERYDVQDTRAFVPFMRAVLALDRGEYEQARVLLDTARAAGEYGTPPPHFIVGIDALDARIAMHEEKGPVAAARSLAAVLRSAKESRLSDLFVAQIAEMAVPVLVLAGEPGLAVRLLSAAGTWRSGSVRSVPERAEAERTEAHARAVLGARGYEAERGAGLSLTLEQAAALLDLPDGPGLPDGPAEQSADDDRGTV